MVKIHVKKINDIYILLPDSNETLSQLNIYAVRGAGRPLSSLAVLMTFLSQIAIPTSLSSFSVLQ